MSQTQPTSEHVYVYICQYVEQHGFAPSLRDIAQGCQLSLSGVNHILHKLREADRIAYTPRIARSLRVVG